MTFILAGRAVSFLPVTGKKFKLNLELISVLIVYTTQATFREIHLA